MRKIIYFTADSFEGDVELRFNELGVLYSTDMGRASLSQEQHEYLVKNMPSRIEDVKKFLSKSPNMKVTEIPEEITFDMFWNKYDDKINSSRKNTMVKWQKMTGVEQAKAYAFIGRYFAALPIKTRKKYAETYLNAELWNN
ncbi:MAG: hypothetical protein H6Q15_2089 [Bacteroidetes bacterium]|nr:hypothetical protein [Bacteroidota bacterium]